MQIKSDVEYESALKRIDELWGATPGTPEGSELDALFTAVAGYEDEHYPVDGPKSYAAVQFHLERLNLALDGLLISNDEKEILRDCIAHSVLLPEWLTEKMSHILGVPRNVLGEANTQDLAPTQSP